MAGEGVIQKQSHLLIVFIKIVWGVVMEMGNLAHGPLTVARAQIHRPETLVRLPISGVVGLELIVLVVGSKVHVESL